MDKQHTCECRTDSEAVLKSKSRSTQSIRKSHSARSTQSIRKSHSAIRSKKDVRDAENVELRNKPSDTNKTHVCAGKHRTKPRAGGAASKIDAAEDQTGPTTAPATAEQRLAVMEEQLRSLQENYRRKQWRHFRYLLPGAAAAAGLGPEADLAAAAIISLRDQVDTLQQTLQEIQERGEDPDIIAMKIEVRHLRDERQKMMDRIQKTNEMLNSYRQQLEEADAQQERAAKRQAELEREYGLAHKALESVICDANDQEYAVNVANAGKRSADIILQLQLRVVELEKALQGEREVRDQLEAEAEEKAHPPPQPSASTLRRESKKAGGQSARKGKPGEEEGPTAEELMERLQVATDELQEARALLEEAEAIRKKQAADYAVLREDVRDLHNRVAAVTQLAKRERSFSDALKEALEDMEVQWRKQFEEDQEQLRQADCRLREAYQKLAAAEDALSCCQREASRISMSLQACRERVSVLRDQLLAAMPQPPSKMIEFLGQKLDETERELEEVRNQLREEQHVSATLEAELCDYDEYFIDGTVTSYRMALTLAGTNNEYQEPIFTKTIALENEIQQLKEQVEQLRVEKLCIIQQCSEELSTSRYLFEEAFNQLVPKSCESDNNNAVKWTLICPKNDCDHLFVKQEPTEKQLNTA